MTGIRITGSGNGKRSGDVWTVPKQLLVNSLLQSLTRKQLKITAPEPGRSALRNEMVHFIRLAGKRAKYEACTGEHDDLVLAAALAVLGKWGN